jgi:glycosyltransferase involved in cell wall biosynthesis
MKSLRSRVKDNRPLRTVLFLAQNAVYGMQSLLKGKHQHGPQEGSRSYTLASLIRVKDEARFLPEWIAHHLNLGVEHVFVYDNNSTDGTETAITPFIDRGLVTYVPWPNVPASPSCEADFLARFGHTSKWVAFLDADEFLFETCPGALADALRSFDDRPAIAVNQRYFGGAGYETIPRGLITERFDRADAGCNRHVKVIARPAMISRYRNSHNFYYKNGRLAVTPEGRRVFGSFITSLRQSSLAVHHYVYRSREDYERKTRRGFVDASGFKERPQQLSLADREFHRHNDVHVEPSAGATRATAELLQRLGYPEEIYEAPGRDHPDKPSRQRL